jgi:hypothetical protein
LFQQDLEGRNPLGCLDFIRAGSLQEYIRLAAGRPGELEFSILKISAWVKVCQGLVGFIGCYTPRLLEVARASP